LPLPSETVVPIGVPLSDTVIVSFSGATPEMVIRLALVMPSLELAPVSGLMPRIVGAALTRISSVGSGLFGIPPPDRSGLPLAYAMIGEASVGGADPLKLRPRA